MPSIPGRHGDWSVEIVPSSNQFGGLASINFSYTPKPDAPCDDGRFVQTVKAVGIDGNGNRVTDRDDIFSPGADPDEGKLGDRTVPDEAGEPVSIDYLVCSKKPWSGSPPIPPARQGEMPIDAVFTDAPGGPWSGIRPAIQAVEMTFEICVVCPQTGVCLGCIRWQMTSRRADQPPDGGQSSIELLAATEQPCSDTGRKALRAFTRTHCKRDPRTGAWSWFCPEVRDDMLDAAGNPVDPFDGAIPDEFWRKVLGIRRVSGLLDQPLGTGVYVSAPAAIFEEMRRRPNFAAVKFTWTGFQMRTTPSVLLCANADFEAAAIAPFIGGPAGRVNDATALDGLGVTGAFMTSAVREVARLERKFRKPGAAPVGITCISEFGTDFGRACRFSMDKAVLWGLVRALAAHLRDIPQGLETLHYLGVNMGRPSRSRKR
jgi:hypothetical protein